VSTEPPTTSLPPPRATCVLVVDDDDATRMLVSRWLAKGGITLFEARSGEEALKIAEERGDELDAVVLDVMMPGLDGFEVCRRLHDLPMTASTPVLLLTAHANDDKQVVLGVEAGAIDHLAKPFSGPVLVAKVKAICARSQRERQLRSKLEFAERHATVDGLTGLFNRRHFDKRLREEMAHAKRHQRPFTVLMIDLDHFKAVNDTFGHAEGDKVLRHVAAAMPKVLREDDMAFRYGGEEFALILRSTTAENAMSVAERLRQLLKSAPIELGAGGSAPEDKVVTYSGGLASADQTNDFDGEAILVRADAALYTAKRSGRDRTVVASAADALAGPASKR
jgi:diguanylate cyclase (GGDEF)-like protein